MLLLLASTAAVAVVSELLVGAVTETARALGLTELFVAPVLVLLS